MGSRCAVLRRLVYVLCCVLTAQRQVSFRHHGVSPPPSRVDLVMAGDTG